MKTRREFTKLLSLNGVAMGSGILDAPACSVPNPDPSDPWFELIDAPAFYAETKTYSWTAWTFYYKLWGTLTNMNQLTDSDEGDQFQRLMLESRNQAKYAWYDGVWTDLGYTQEYSCALVRVVTGQVRVSHSGTWGGEETDGALKMGYNIVYDGPGTAVNVTANLKMAKSGTLNTSTIGFKKSFGSLSVGFSSADKEIGNIAHHYEFQVV